MFEAEWEPRCRCPRELVLPVPVDPTGRDGPTRGQARGPRWRRTSPGRYVPTTARRDLVEQRILEAWAGAGPGAVVTGWAALRLAGVAYCDGLTPDRALRPVEVVLARHQRRTTTLVPLRARLPQADTTHTRGIPRTTLERALFDAMTRAEGLREAVLLMDMAAAARLTSVERMRTWVEARPGALGRRRVLRALDLAVDDSRSPGESRMRLIWVLDAQLPAPLCNRAVYDLSGRFLGIPDLLDPLAGLVGEYDGAVHAGSARRRRDTQREEAFRSVGLETFRVVTGELHTPAVVCDRMLAAYRRARFLPPERRAWRLRE